MLNIELVIFVSFLVHLVSSIILILITIFKKTQRTKFFPILFGVNLGVFLTFIFTIPNFLEFQPIDFVAFVGYSLIISYVISIEIPGYILHSRYDSRLGKTLEDFRQNCIAQNFQLDLTTLRNEFAENERMFEDVHLKKIVDSFVSRSEQISNIDQTLYEITIKEIGEQIQFISKRSKHPFPKLIEIFSLAGISFLLGQFLNYIF